MDPTSLMMREPPVGRFFMSLHWDDDEDEQDGLPGKSIFFLRVGAIPAYGVDWLWLPYVEMTVFRLVFSYGWFYG